MLFAPAVRPLSLWRTAGSSDLWSCVCVMCGVCRASPSVRRCVLAGLLRCALIIIPRKPYQYPVRGSDRVAPAAPALPALSLCVRLWPVRRASGRPSPVTVGVRRRARDRKDIILKHERARVHTQHSASIIPGIARATRDERGDRSMLAAARDTPGIDFDIEPAHASKLHMLHAPSRSANSTTMCCLKNSVELAFS